MIGYHGDTCQYTVCESTSTRLFTDEFKMLNSKLEEKTERKQVRVCRAHTEYVQMERARGNQVWMSQEGWFYVDVWEWLFYQTS